MSRDYEDVCTILQFTIQNVHNSEHALLGVLTYFSKYWFKYCQINVTNKNICLLHGENLYRCWTASWGWLTRPREPWPFCSRETASALHPTPALSAWAAWGPQVWSLSSFEVSCELSANDLIQVSWAQFLSRFCQILSLSPDYNIVPR